VDWTALILPVSIAVFAIGALIVLTPRVVGTAARQVIKQPCPVCQRPLESPVNQLLKVGLHEVGFVVRECPEAYGRPLGELKCPGCKSSHIFAVDTVPATFLVTNAVSATARQNTCNQCRTPLKAPAWRRGAFDGRWREAPGLDPKHGLACAQCGAIACYECCETASRGRTAEGVLRCPRCFRVPMEKFMHF
jgi:hypothetical protein